MGNKLFSTQIMIIFEHLRAGLDNFRQDKLINLTFAISKLVIAALCVANAVAHVFVLFGLLSVEKMRLQTRQFYFAQDLLVSLTSWMLTGRNSRMVAFQAVIHLSAMAHLFAVMPTFLMQDIFEMSEL